MKNILNMETRQIEDLFKFAKDGIMHFSVHNAYGVFLDYKEDIPGNGPLFERFVNMHLETIVELVSGITTFDKESFAPFRPPSVFYKASPESEENSNLYLQAVARFMNAYQFLQEHTYLMHLKETESLCVLVLPKGAPESSNHISEYADYLDNILEGSPNFLTVESMEYNTGYLHLPYKLGQPEMTNRERLDKIDQIVDLLCISAIHLFGGYLNNCLNQTEKSLENCEGEFYSKVLLDLSVHKWKYLNWALTKYESSHVYGELGDLGYPRLVTAVESILEDPQDLRGVEAAIGQPAETQLQILGNYKNLLPKLQKIRELLYTQNKTDQWHRYTFPV